MQKNHAIYRLMCGWGVGLALTLGSTLLSAATPSTASNSAVSQPAVASDALIEGAKLCTRYMTEYERRYGIPKHLLMAISSTESGRYSDRLRMVVPWPWTINAAGKGYYFSSKQEAIDAVRRIQASGVNSIDIGCMQVNLKHHPKAFTSLSHAFDPAANVEYGAKFVRSNFDGTRSWTKAIAYYHSQTPDRGNNYMQMVYRTWKNVLSRKGEDPSQMIDIAVREAPASGPLFTERRRTPANATKRISVASALDGAAERRQAQIERPRMKIIKVYDKPMEVAFNETPRNSQTMGFTANSDRKVVVVRPQRSMIIQDVAEAQEETPKVSVGQFAPKRDYSTVGGISQRVSSADRSTAFVFNN